MRQHFHRCPNLRVVIVEASEIMGNRKGGSVILDELCEAKKLSPCLGLAECDILTDGQRRELLAARVTRLREREGGPSVLGDADGARQRELAELARELEEERTEIVETHRRMRAEATAAFDERADDAPLGADEDVHGSGLSAESAQPRRARLDAIERALEEMATGAYGRCVRCGGAIDVSRLHHEPDTHVCRECARKGSPLA
jgi:DnaK suppressor protein